MQNPNKQMHISKWCIDNIFVEFEGIREDAYLCPAKVVTIGIGETGKFALTGQKIYLGMHVTKDEAKRSFAIAVTEYEDAVKKYITVPLNQNQFDAIVSLVYNCGWGIISKDTQLKRAINSKQWNVAANLFINDSGTSGYIYCKGKILGGLVRRRKVEKSLFMKQFIVDDEDLSSAVSKIIKSGINITFNNWKRADLIEIKNVPELLNRLGGLDSLVESGIITQKNIWYEGKYSKQNVRSLLIKYSKARA